MEEKRVTIKEIAQMAGVSVGTVHGALYNKPGVSQKTRDKVLRIARENHYRINATAAALKRKPKKVAVVIPTLASANRYYFNSVWEALRHYKNTINDLNISFTDIPYYTQDPLLVSELSRIKAEPEIGGVIGFSAYMSEEAKQLLGDMGREGKIVVLVGERDSQGTALCSVFPDYRMTGRLVGELLSRQMKGGGPVLVCAGDVQVSSHYEVVNGLAEFFSEAYLENPLIRKHYSHDREDYYHSLLDVLEKNPEMEACFAVTARESVLLGRALEESGRAGKMLAVGSDLFEENIAFLNKGTFTNLLNKHPYLQMQKALDCMVNRLARDERPKGREICVGTEVVFKSTLFMYGEDGRERILL